MIDTLWKKDESGMILENIYSREEYKQITNWNVFEWFEGIEVSVLYARQSLIFPKNRLLREYMKYMLNQSKIRKEFPFQTVLFNFRIRGNRDIKNWIGNASKENLYIEDIKIDNEWQDFEDMSRLSGIFGYSQMPFIGTMNVSMAVGFLKRKGMSMIKDNMNPIQGLIGKSSPLMLFKDQEPIVWELRLEDYGVNE